MTEKKRKQTIKATNAVITFGGIDCSNLISGFAGIFPTSSGVKKEARKTEEIALKVKMKVSARDLWVEILNEINGVDEPQDDSKVTRRKSFKKQTVLDRLEQSKQNKGFR